MAGYHVPPLERLVDKFESLPGVGHKSAQRIAYAVLNMDKADAESFAQAIIDAHEQIHYCSVCCNLTDGDLCPVCRDESRDRSVICVVEDPRDVFALERTNEFHATYHVLHGAISPLGGIGPDQLKIKELLRRVKDGTVQEVIMATGKTTCAKILAKAVNCMDPQNGDPCGKCDVCRGLDDGSVLDVVELDAASNNGVDSIRALIEESNFTPTTAKYRVYIIDEVHMLSVSAFNALLKTLEEPPAHVIFILATTEVHKLLPTILSRCQRFDFRRIAPEDIAGRLEWVCTQENVTIDHDAAMLIAVTADGGMRDALSTLEQLSVFGNGAVHADDARSLLGEVSDQILGEFARAIADRDVAELYGLIRAQVEEGNDLLELTRDLVAHVRDVYVALSLIHI